jgi:hypothetical protein
MTTVDDLLNKKLRDITSDDLRNLVLSGDEKIVISRSVDASYVDGLTMEYSLIGSWQFHFDNLPTYIFHFSRFSDMPKSIQDLWTRESGDTEPELKHD